jgi:hypothetical protein
MAGVASKSVRNTPALQFDVTTIYYAPSLEFKWGCSTYPCYLLCLTSIISLEFDKWKAEFFTTFGFVNIFTISSNT